jgi:hypothetical protein
MRGRKAPEVVLNLVKVLDEEIATPGRLTED